MGWRATEIILGFFWFMMGKWRAYPALAGFSLGGTSGNGAFPSCLCWKSLLDGRTEV